MNNLHPYLIAESQLPLDLVKLQQKAYLGDADAQFALASAFQKGRNIIKNAKYAFYWFKKAANQGNIAAQYNVWFSYLIGDGVEKDESEANRWYQKAALKNSQSTNLVINNILNPTCQ